MSAAMHAQAAGQIRARRSRPVVISSPSFPSHPGQPLAVAERRNASALRGMRGGVPSHRSSTGDNTASDRALVAPCGSESWSLPWGGGGGSGRGGGRGDGAAVGRGGSTRHLWGTASGEAPAEGGSSHLYGALWRGCRHMPTPPGPIAFSQPVQQSNSLWPLWVLQ